MAITFGLSTAILALMWLIWLWKRPSYVSVNDPEEPEEEPENPSVDAEGYQNIPLTAMCLQNESYVEPEQIQ